jgi:predicted alpha/beta-fold hydrolase
LDVKEFVPHGMLRNPHAMTIAANFWPRPVPELSKSVPRLFETEPGTQVRGECHWQLNPREHPTLVLLHGLEGSCDSNYMRGTGEKAWVAGFNVVRLNQRNCGGTERLSSTLYHSGLSCDIHAVANELIERDGLPEIFAAGFSMGGNLVLKMAGDMAARVPAELCAVVAVNPALDLASCADALSAPKNLLYERHFVTRLKRRMRYKASLYPELYPLHGVAEFRKIRTVRKFDDVVTACYCSFEDASDYYAKSSALRVASEIRVPTLIITAQDDPFVPFEPFQSAQIRDNPNITLVAPEHGGHCAFISRENGGERFWAEARIVEFCINQSHLSRGAHLSNVNDRVARKETVR